VNTCSTFAAVVVPAWFLVTFGIARTSFYYAVRRRESKMDQLAERLATTAQQLIGSGPKLPSR
jgi:hypothetical protein